MRLNRSCLLLGHFCFATTILLQTAWAARKDCEPALTPNPIGKYRFSKTGLLAGLDLTAPSQRDRSLANILVHYFSKKKSAPTFDQLVAWAEKHTDHESEAIVKAIKECKLFKKDGLNHRKMAQVFEAAAKEDPDFYTHLHGVFAQQAFFFFRHRLRPPTVSELAETLGIEDTEFVSVVVNLPGFWDGLVESDLGRHIDYVKKRINAAYARAVRGSDTPAAHRTRKIPPTTRRLVEILALARGNEHYQWRVVQGDYLQHKLYDAKGDQLNEESKEAMLATLTAELEAILGLRELDRSGATGDQQWVFKMPVLYPRGIEELYESTRTDFQPTFTSYTDTKRFPIARAQQIAKVLEESPGFLVSSFMPGRPLDWAQIEGMKQMGREKGLPVCLIPENGLWQDIDAQLLSDPEIHILTHSISNSELLISTFPSNDRGNVLGPFKKPGMFEIGQQIIVPHSSLEHESIPTAKNAQNQTQLYSTGTVNKPVVSAVGSSQIAKAEQIANLMKQAFLVVEKIDRGTEADHVGGVGNHWHIRPVEVKPERGPEPLVFVDNTIAYRVYPNTDGRFKVDVGTSYATTIYMSDAHFLFASPKVLMAAEHYISQQTDPGVQFQIVVPDPIDNFFANGHIQKKQHDVRTIRGSLKNGRMLGDREINDLIGNYNAMLREFPNAVVISQKSNHTDWIDRHVINDPTTLQEFVNGDLRDELLMALKYNPQWSPLEYLLLHREAFLKRLNMDGSDRWAEGKVFISDTTRVRVLQAGEPLSTVSNYRGLEMALQHHGDKGANGGRSSFPTHQMGERRSITGDAHRMGYKGGGDNFWIGVGSMMHFGAEYTKEGYSSWGVGLGVVYADGLATLAQYDPISESFSQRGDYGTLSPRNFFGNDPLTVIEPMDNDAARIAVDEQVWAKWLENKVRWLYSASGRGK